MGFKMAAVQGVLLLLVGVMVGDGIACPSPCDCSNYRGKPEDIHVDCSGKGLQRIPQHDFPTNTRSINLANNQLTEIDGQLTSLPLMALNLSGNNLQGLDYNGGQGIQNFVGDCDLEDFVFNRITIVNVGHWSIMDLTEAHWPCFIDLRNNPISQIKRRSFQGSKNFTLFLGESSSGLILESGAFLDTENVIGLHITNVPSLTFIADSITGMRNIGWLVIDKTRLEMRGDISSAEDLDLHWLRISNTNVTRLHGGDLSVKMDVETTCYVKTSAIGSNKPRTVSTATIHKGGIELINNTLPVLPQGLFLHSNMGGVYLKGNKIAGFEAHVFRQAWRETDLCILRFEDNQFDTLPSGSFGGLRNIVHVSVSGGNMASIEAEAFASSRNIGSLAVSVTGTPDNDQVVIKSKAFTEVTGVKVFSVSGIDGWGNAQKIKPKLVIQSNAFNGLKNVDYMAVNLHENMQILPENLFTGLTVNQDFILRVSNLSRIKATAFGKAGGQTRINHLNVEGFQNFPCDCETAMLNTNLKVTVKDVQALTCTAPFEDGTISHAWRLDHATCSANFLQFNLALVILISLFSWSL